MARAQLLVAVLASLAAFFNCQRAPTPYHFFYPPQRGYVRQVPVPQRLPPFRGAPAVTQTVYVVVEEGDAEEQRELLDAIPSLLEMLSAKQSPHSALPSAPGGGVAPTNIPVFLDDAEPQFDTSASQQDSFGGDSVQQGAPHPVPGGEGQAASGASSQLEYPKDPSNAHLDYPMDEPAIDVRSGFTGKLRPRVKPQESALQF